MTQRTRSRLLITAGVMAIPAAALAWWLGSPLFLDAEVDETFPAAPAAPVGGAGSEEPPQLPETPPALLRGSFVDADAAHRGSGTATVYELADGSQVLRFEDFEVTNGPDLHVLLVPSDRPIDRDLLETVGYEDLGKLRGNIGNQNYTLPAALNPDEAWTVVIYCEPLHVVFSTAPLSA